MVRQDESVHHFWHTFDIAVTRFSERVIEQPASVDPVTREAYSREVISASFWFGSPDFPTPAFYPYTAPEPPDLAEQPLVPASAHWLPSRGSHLAVLDYEVERTSSSPRDTVRSFWTAPITRVPDSRAGTPHAATAPAASPTRSSHQSPGRQRAHFAKEEAHPDPPPVAPPPSPWRPTWGRDVHHHLAGGTCWPAIPSRNERLRHSVAGGDRGRRSP